MFFSQAKERIEVRLTDSPLLSKQSASSSYSDNGLSDSPFMYDWIKINDTSETDKECNMRESVVDCVQRLEQELHDFKQRYDKEEKRKQQLEQYYQRLVENLNATTPTPPGSSTNLNQLNLQREMHPLTSTSAALGADHWQRRCLDLERQLEALQLQNKPSQFAAQVHQPPVKSERDLLLQQISTYKEDFLKERTEKENLTAEVKRLRSESNKIKVERDKAEKEKSEVQENLAKFKEEVKALKDSHCKTKMEQGVLLRQFAKLRATLQPQASSTHGTPAPSSTAKQPQSSTPMQTVTREQMPFDLRWTCKACSFVNRRMISACEVCAAKTELPMYIDGYEVTTPEELQNRKEQKNKKSFVLINPTSSTQKQT